MKLQEASTLSWLLQKLIASASCEEERAESLSTKKQPALPRQITMALLHTGRFQISYLLEIIREVVL
jgi:hypothetical protein